MTRLMLLLTLFLALPCLAAPWDEYAPYAESFPALDPTPTGDGHMGIIESGQTVQLRFPVPRDAVAAYRVNLGNIVAYTGKGQSYQLIIRIDRADGPVVHEGPVIGDGDAWNATNRESIDLTPSVKPEHRKQGYVDLFVTGVVTGDGWTVYKQQPGRPMVAQAVVLTPEIERRIAMSRQMAERGIAIIPQPQQCDLREGDVTLKGFAESKPGQQFLRQEINERVKELGRPEFKQTGSGARIWLAVDSNKTAIAGLRKLGFAAKPSGHAQGYALEAQKAGVAVVGDDEAGLFYGVQTLRQLLAAGGTAGGVRAPALQNGRGVRAGTAGGVRAPALQNGRGVSVPALLISDWPEYPLRGWQYDIARGQTINLDFCQRLVRESARHKMNCIMLYMEGDFIFEKYPFVGREGTFDRQKGLALDEYATQYHLQLIPQYEALGHASATLKHEQLKDLRENGSPWVYCTSEPKTWQFLDDVFGELAAAFPHSKYFHVGADEFEMTFGLCPRCKAKGIGPLYVEHMTKLNDICKKYGRKMLFWPSHYGPTEELSYLSLKHAQDMPKDCIPTEWIYHGPASYPEILQYQQAGYEDVFVCPAVVDYSIIWPDYPMTFRGIKGFFEAGRGGAGYQPAQGAAGEGARSTRKPCGGAICTTWELMYGGLYENSWYGIIYAAECGWSLGKTSKSDYDRRFAADWFGITDPGAADLIAQALYEPIPATGEAAMWRNGKLVKDLFWCPPQDFRRRFMQRQPVYLEKAGALREASDAWAAKVMELGQYAERNLSTVRYADHALRMHRHVSAMLMAFDAMAQDYAEAQKALPADPSTAAESLRAVNAVTQVLMEHAGPMRVDLRQAVDTMGAYKGDLDSLNKQVEGLNALATRVTDLAAQVKTGALKQLPPAEELGLGLKPFTKVGSWEPAHMSETDKELRWDLSAFIKGPGTYRVEFEYTHGAHGLAMRDVRLLADGQVVAQDNHTGWAGGGSRGNLYLLKLDTLPAGQKIELAAIIRSSGGTDSRGDIWLASE